MKPTGLSDAEAKKLFTQYGANEITGQPRQTPLSIFLSQFTSTLILLLVIASIASLFLGDVLDGIFILLIVILNGILGFVQEYRAENAIAALKKMTVTFARVVRNGTEAKIDSKLLVPGDIIRVEEGDNIPADCLLLNTVHLEVNESSLTGESIPIEKNIHEEDKKYIYMGTTATHGHAIARVVATGMQTKFGAIASSLSDIRAEETPLEKKIGILGKQLGIIALGASGIVLAIGIWEKQPAITMILASISLAGAAVPEGLPAVITITLAVGTQRMARKKAILRKLSAIEALGGITVIATDKTGTLTKNQMRVTRVWTKDEEKLLTNAVLCNNASLVMKEKGGYDVLGDTTEGALLLLAIDKGQTPESIRQNGTLVEEYGFDAVRKLMSVVVKKRKTLTVYTKGAPEVVLSCCTRYNGSPLTQEARRTIEKTYTAYANEGLRVIALAEKDVQSVPAKRDAAERDLNFIGLVGISDPPREEVKEAIALARAAGIRTIMITGDNELTARAIASHIGLMQTGDEVITGKQFAALSDEEAMAKLPTIRILARTAPDEKLRVVRLLQRMGHVVAVTGDGVNDALALKQSDVGVAMGITGTDVAKEAAEMVITDDNYATIVTAVEEGRTIFDNIKSAIQYLVGCNLGEVIAVLAGMLMGWPLILSPLQLLYVNLVTDGLPAIALAITPKRESIMNRKPRTGSGIFSRRDFYWFAETSLLTAACTLGAFWLGYQTGSIVLAQTLAFTTLILVQHVILLDVWVRERSVFNFRLYKNRFFLFTFFTPIFMQCALLFVPAIASVFKVTQITWSHAGIIVLISSTLIISSELRKHLR